MSNTIVNWRFWAWHLQVIRWGDWRGTIRMGRSPITLMRNEFWAKGGWGREKPEDWSPIAIYEGGAYMALPLALIALMVWALVCA